ncbi:uncharacterized protein LOC126872552 isoform X3 [Bombus huntii]|uniref:uncharacterized protein LOC126872552 isoform X3 n=1 Tax=Bombus huntii TaxID=85661 RepID=UPI0021A97BFD|nr:uncharacterized protein LOC126872552 isoform X3 [Bombus huntii]
MRLLQRMMMTQYVGKIKKSLCGLKQSGRMWFKHIYNILKTEYGKWSGCCNFMTFRSTNVFFKSVAIRWIYDSFVIEKSEYD